MIPDNYVHLAGMWQPAPPCPWCLTNISKHHDTEACRDAYIAQLRSLQRSTPGWMKKEWK